MSNSMTSWTVALQAPLSMGFSRQEYWSGLPFPSPMLVVLKLLISEPKGLSFYIVMYSTEK